MRKWLMALLVLPAVAFATLGASAVPAAATDTAYIEVAGFDDYINDVLSEESRNSIYQANAYLPLNRWSGMPLHSRLNQWNVLGAGINGLTRSMSGVVLTAGNQVWGAATSWTQAASGMSTFNGAFGYQVDRLTGVLGQAFVSSPVLLGLLVGVFIMTVLWRRMRSRNVPVLGRAIQGTIVLAIIAFTSSQAALGTQQPFTGEYKPRPLSPVWIASALSNAIDSAAGSIATPLMGVMRNTSDELAGGVLGDGGRWSCNALLDATFAKSDESIIKGTAGVMAVTKVLNTMWSQSAPPVYRLMQFGENKYAEHVWCRQLERSASANADSSARLLIRAVTGQNGNDLTAIGLVHPSQPLLVSTSNNDLNDRMMVAWAACAPKVTKPTGPGSFTVRAGFSKKSGLGGDNGTWITGQNCWDVWQAGDEARALEVSGAFDVWGDTADTLKVSTDPDVVNFLNTLHAADTVSVFGGSVSAAIYLIGALFSALIFGLLALVVIGAKIFMNLMLALVFLVMIAALFRQDSIATSLSGPASRFLGVAFFSFGASLVLTVVGTMSLMIVGFGTSLFGAPGTAGHLIWVAVSPLIAVISVHLLFTRVLRKPSPVTARGALAWGVAGGAAGGAIANAVANRVSGATKAGARNVADHAAAATLGKSKMGSMLLNERQQRLARGAGDAGPRRANEAGEDTAAAQGGVGARERNKVAREAKREWVSNNTLRGRTMQSLRDRFAPDRDAQLETLREAMRAAQAQIPDGAGEPARHPMADLLRNPDAVGRTNDGFEEFGGLGGFMLAPGEEPTVGTWIDRLTWDDLTPEGRVEATHEHLTKLREQRRAAREAAKTSGPATTAGDVLRGAAGAAVPLVVGATIAGPAGIAAVGGYQALSAISRGRERRSAERDTFIQAAVASHVKAAEKAANKAEPLSKRPESPKEKE